MSKKKEAYKKRIEKTIGANLSLYKDCRYSRGYRLCRPSDVIGHSGRGNTYITISKQDTGAARTWTRKTKRGEKPRKHTPRMALGRKGVPGRIRVV